MTVVIRTMGDVSLEQRLTSAMHTAIHALVKVAEEGTDSGRVAAATAILELGIKNGIAIIDDPEPRESDGPVVAESFQIGRSHATAFRTKGPTYD